MISKEELFKILGNADESDILEWIGANVATREIAILALNDDPEIVMEEIATYRLCGLIPEQEVK